MPETSNISSARHAFRILANGLYLDNREDVTTCFDTLMKNLEEIPDLVSLELYANWERLKPHYEVIGNHEQALIIQSKLKERALRYIYAN